MNNKLYSISKIMAATGAINYMAVAIDSVNEQMKMIPEQPKVMTQSDPVVTPKKSWLRRDSDWFRAN